MAGHVLPNNFFILVPYTAGGCDLMSSSDTCTREYAPCVTAAADAVCVTVLSEHLQLHGRLRVAYLFLYPGALHGSCNLMSSMTHTLVNVHHV
jgi:hypothetical protein